jgi:hypothetical protein
MNRKDNYLITALAFSAVLMLVNIIAVTNGAADGYYQEISNWLNNL